VAMKNELDNIQCKLGVDEQNPCRKLIYILRRWSFFHGITKK